MYIAHRAVGAAGLEQAEISKRLEYSVRLPLAKPKESHYGYPAVMSGGTQQAVPQMQMPLCALEPYSWSCSRKK